MTDFKKNDSALISERIVSSTSYLMTASEKT